MAVINVSQITTRPEKLAQQLDLARQSKKILESHGARNVRWMTPLAGPLPSTDVVICTWEAEDYEAWGRITQAIYGDPTMIEIMGGAIGPDGPSVSYTQSILVDLDVG